MTSRLYFSFFSVSALWVFVFFLHPVHAAADAGTIPAILAKGIHATFCGEYDQAEAVFATIRQVDPDHPSRPFYQAVVLFWRNNIDSGNPRYVNRIRELLETAKEMAENMLVQDADNIDALHYMGLTYTYLGRLEAHNGKLYRGGVLGEQGRRYLEQAIEICGQKEEKRDLSETMRTGTCQDVYFPFGAYSYFAGRLPRFLQALNFLWFIPSGSTEEGLAALQRALANSELHRLGARSLLAAVYLNFEAGQLQAARRLSADLVQRFPDNPYLELQHANVLNAAGEYAQAVARSDSIIKKADTGLRNYDSAARQGALQVRAEAAIHQGQLRQAGKILANLDADPAFQNNSLRPQTDLLLGMLADAADKREEAVAHYDQARSYKGAMRNRTVARKAKQYLDEPYRGSSSS